MNKKIIYLAAALIAAILAVIILVRSQPTQTNKSPQESTELTGKIECAPKKGGGAVTLECAYGLQAADGKHYLINTAKFPAGTNTSQYEVNTQVVVTGEVSNHVAGHEQYDVAGVISATAIRKK